MREEPAIRPKSTASMERESKARFSNDGFSIFCFHYQRNRIASWMMRGVTTPEGPPSPWKFFAASNVARWKSARVRTCPLVPR